MCRMHVLALWCVMLLLSTAAARADRPREDRNQADYVLSGTVLQIYATGYNAGTREVKSRDYIVELRIEEVTKGERLKKGDIFRAACSYHKPEPFEAAGHNNVPEAGQRIRVYVKDGRGSNVGIWPDWYDVLPKTNK